MIYSGKYHYPHPAASALATHAAAPSPGAAKTTPNEPHTAPGLPQQITARHILRGLLERNDALRSGVYKRLNEAEVDAIETAIAVLGRK